MKSPYLFKIRIKKYRILQHLASCMLDPEPVFREMIKIKNDVPQDLYGYYIRGMYQMNTYGLSKEVALKAFEGIPKRRLMEKSELKKYESLPDKIVIYRGTTDLETDSGLSWSLNINVAKKYYRGALLSAEIEKQQIIALFKQNTCEEEVLANLNKSQITQIA